MTNLNHVAIFFVVFLLPLSSSFFFFNDPATTEIYTLSLHDALPISRADRDHRADRDPRGDPCAGRDRAGADRKSTRLNSSHQIISYAVFCLKKKKKKNKKKNKWNKYKTRQ